MSVSLKAILTRIDHLRDVQSRLEEKYLERPKGTYYEKRSRILNEQIEQQLERIRNLGTNTPIFQVSFEHNNPDIKEQFHVFTFFTDINKEDIPEICKYRFPDRKIINILEVSPGFLNFHLG